MSDKKPKYPVVVVHGICDKCASQQEGFSRVLRDNVFPEGADRESYWHEAIWEKVTEAADSKMQDEVLKLVNAYNKTEYWLDEQLAKRHSLIGRVLAYVWWSFGVFARFKSVDKLTQTLDLLLDLPLYMGNPRGNRVRDVVRDEISKAASVSGNSVILVGHSLGSVIAYDVVRENLENGCLLPIKALVTFGSPLDWVQDLRVAEGDVVRSKWSVSPVPWYNYYDPKDPVCMMQEFPMERFDALAVNASTSSGKCGIGAHTAYWRSGDIASRIRSLAYGEL